MKILPINQCLKKYNFEFFSLNSTTSTMKVAKFKINSLSIILDIGFSNDYLILKTSDNKNILIDLYTMDIVKSKNLLVNNIKWLNISNNIDIF